MSVFRDRRKKEIDLILGKLRLASPDSYKIFSYIIQKLDELSGSTERLFDLFDLISEINKRNEAEFSSIKERLDRLEARLERVENKLGVLAEASFSRLALGELERLGYKILDYKRNVMIGEREIDLIAYTVRGNEEYTIVLEVKSKPDHADAAKLVGVADMVAGSGLARGRVVPALAGVLVGSDVEAYARKLGVLVLKL